MKIDGDSFILRFGFERQLLTRSPRVFLSSFLPRQDRSKRQCRKLLASLHLTQADGREPL